MTISRVGVDVAKSVFHVHGVDRHDQVQWRGKYARDKWLDALANRVPVGAEIAMEACASSHHWARELQARGYHVKLIAAQFVKPYVKSNKNDQVDAEAICEAMGRPTMRFVAAKTAAQQDIQATNRIREELVQQRTALPRWLEDAGNGLTDNCRFLLAGLAEDLRYLDDRIATVTECIAHHAKTDPVAKRLMTLRGVGIITASALAGALGNAKAFKRGRDFAASLGLTPRQHSTGGRDRLLGISKRGDSYLRTLLVHGARAVLRYTEGKEDNLSHWVRQLTERKHVNVAVIALANKTARIAWSITCHDSAYDPDRAAQAA